MMYIVYINIKLFYIISYRELLYRDICLYRVYRTSLHTMYSVVRFLQTSELYMKPYEANHYKVTDQY